MKKSLCDKLEEATLQQHPDAVEIWHEHARGCPECREKIRLLRQLQSAADQLNEHLDLPQQETLRRALGNRSAKVPLLWPRYAVAAMVVALLAIVIFIPRHYQGCTFYAAIFLTRLPVFLT